MKIAYKRDKEHKRKNAKSSKFVSLIRELVEREEAAAEAEAKARGEAAQDEDYDAFARVPPPPFAPTPLGEARAEGRLGAELRARALHGYLTLGWAVHTWCTRSFWFECFIMANILAVGASTGLSLNGEEDGSPAVATLVQVVNDVTMWVFVAEALLKLLSYGAQPLHYFTAPNGEGSFNSFDFLLVVLSLALAGESSAGGIKTLRLARLVRLLTIIKNVPELKVIVEGLVAGLKSVGYIVLLLLLVIYLFAVLGVMQFGANDPANFGKLPVAMVTLFQVSTLSSWSNIAYIQWFGCDKFIRGWYDGSDESGETVMTMTGPLLVWQCSAPSAQPLFTFVYFTAFTIVTAMVILSLFIGVIAMGMFDSYESMKEVAAAREYATGLRAATSSLFAPGSPLALKIDCAMERSPKRAERDAHPVAWKERLVVLAHKAAFVESHAAFQGAITGCIIIAGVVIGLSTDRIGSMAALAGLDLFCLLVFTLEVFVKVAALGLEPLKYFNDSWNRFDLLIVANGWLEVLGFSFDGLTILRLLRLLRVFRLVKALPRLRSIVESLIQGFTSVVWVMVLMAIFNYITSCLGVLLFQHNDPFYYGSVMQAMLSTYQVETLDGWDELLRGNMYGCGHFPGGYPIVIEGAPHSRKYDCPEGSQGFGFVAAFYFIFVVVFGGLILPTMLIGIVAISFEESFRSSEAEKKNAEETALVIMQVMRDNPSFFTVIRIELLRVVFNAMDVDGGGTLDLNEVTPLIQYICWRHLRVQLEAPEIEALVLFFDENNTSDLNFGELLLIIRYVIKAQYEGRLKGIQSAKGKVPPMQSPSFSTEGSFDKRPASSGGGAGSRPASSGGGAGSRRREADALLMDIINGGESINEFASLETLAEAPTSRETPRGSKAGSGICGDGKGSGSQDSWSGSGSGSGSGSKSRLDGSRQRLDSLTEKGEGKSADEGGGDGEDAVVAAAVAALEAEAEALRDELSDVLGRRRKPLRSHGHGGDGWRGGHGLDGRGERHALGEAGLALLEDLDADANALPDLGDHGFGDGSGDGPDGGGGGGEVMTMAQARSIARQAGRRTSMHTSLL